jgi:hypothetical protein
MSQSIASQNNGTGTLQNIYEIVQADLLIDFYRASDIWIVTLRAGVRVEDPDHAATQASFMPQLRATDGPSKDCEEVKHEKPGTTYHTKRTLGHPQTMDPERTENQHKSTSDGSVNKLHHKVPQKAPHRRGQLGPRRSLHKWSPARTEDSGRLSP